MYQCWCTIWSIFLMVILVDHLLSCKHLGCGKGTSLFLGIRRFGECWSRSKWAIFLFRLTSLGLLWERALFMHKNRDAFLSKCNRSYLPESAYMGHLCTPTKQIAMMHTTRPQVSGQYQKALAAADGLGLHHNLISNLLSSSEVTMEAPCFRSI
jgi:hypothetical protein